MKNERTTTARVLLPAVCTTTAERITRAHNRHRIDTRGNWYGVPATKTAPAAVRCPVHLQTPAQLYATADTATAYTLRAREQAAALDLFRQLAGARAADTLHRDFDRIGTQAAEAEQERDTHRQAAATLRAYAERKTITTAEATAARRAAAAHTKAADKAADRLKDLERVLNTATASDRADLVQAAVIAALTHDHETDPNGAFAAMCAAVGKSIGSIASPTALTATRTKVREITREEAAALIATYGEGAKIPHNVRGATSACFDTVELRTRGKGESRRPVWCIVSHYLTTAPYVSFEVFATGEEAATLATNGGINAIGTMTDSAEIADLLTRANLTERESAIVYLVADQTAARHGQRAAAAYWQKRTAEIAALSTKHLRNKAHRAAQDSADLERIAAQWASAFNRVGITSQNNRDVIKCRIKTKLTEAAKPFAPATADEAREIARLHRNGNRGHYDHHTARVDLVQVVTAWAKTQATPAAVIAWTECTAEPQTLTRAEVLTERAAEDIRTYDRARIEYRRRLRDAEAPAARSAFVFFEQMTEAAQTRAACAYWQEQEQTRRAAALASVAAKYPTFDQWQKMTRTERAACAANGGKIAK